MRRQSSAPAGNVSGLSNAVTVELAGNGDSTPPTAPTGLSVEDLDDNCGSLILRWTPSTDNLDDPSAIEYERYRNGSFFQLTPRAPRPGRWWRSTARATAQSRATR